MVYFKRFRRLPWSNLFFDRLKISEIAYFILLMQSHPLHAGELGQSWKSLRNSDLVISTTSGENPDLTI